MAGPVEEAVAQRGEHSDAAVGAGAAAEREKQAITGQREAALMASPKP